MHQLDVFLDLKPDVLEADAMVFNGTDPEATTVEFCVRLDLLMDKSKFYELSNAKNGQSQPMNVSVGSTVGANTFITE